MSPFCKTPPASGRRDLAARKMGETQSPESRLVASYCLRQPGQVRCRGSLRATANRLCSLKSVVQRGYLTRHPSPCSDGRGSLRATARRNTQDTGSSLTLSPHDGCQVRSTKTTLNWAIQLATLPRRARTLEGSRHVACYCSNQAKPHESCTGQPDGKTN